MPPPFSHTLVSPGREVNVVERSLNSEVFRKLREASGLEGRELLPLRVFEAAVLGANPERGVDSGSGAPQLSG
ncbi:hypothetical protein [Planctomicrobium sp. SH664]|uniref:hypothetical protein n=1 Tax=Planctomicrobium sp. SH664 TaxID=3448125 RepID=UPI003F5C82EF